MKLPGYAPCRGAALLRAAARASRRRSMSRICSARITSRPPTATTTSRRARRERSRATRRLSLLGGKLRGARLDALEVADEQSAFLAAAVLFGDAEQEAGVDGDPAFAAVGELQRRAADSCRSPSPCRTGCARRSRRARRSPAGGSARAPARSTSGRPRSRPRRACCGCASCRAATNLKCLTALVT